MGDGNEQPPQQIHVWLPQDMVDEIDAFAKRMGLRNRSAAVAVLLARGLGRNGGGASPVA